MAGRIAYLGNISTQGLVLDLDAAIQGSYPKTGSLWTDISGNNNNGTLVNGPAYTGSDYGAIVFDGVNDYVNIPTFNQTFSSLTLGTWIKLAGSQSNFAGVIYSRGGGGSTTGLNFIGSIFGGNGYKLGLTYNDTGFTTPGPELLDNTWTQVYLAFSPTSTVYYINGSPSLTLPSYGSTTTLSSLKLGYDTDTATRVFKGSMAQAQIYNQALSQFQVWQNFNAYKSRYGIPDIVTDGLILNLDAGNPYSYLSGSSGTTWTDTSGIGNNGTLTNGPVYNNGAITFDGVNDYCDINNTALPSGSNSHTVSAWIYKQGDNTSNGWVSLATWGTNSNNQKRMIFVSSQSSLGNKIYTGFYNNDYNWGTGITNNVWTYLVWTFDGSSEAIYLNGSLYGTHSVSSVNTVLGTNHSIGGYFDTNFISYYNGRISDFQIYNRALTQTEITQNFNALRGRYGI